MVGNAIKFSSDNQSIYIRVKYFEDKHGHGWAKFSVKDEGLGIKNEDVKKILGKYQQLESGASKKLGIGLGLSIVNEFTKAHQGYLEIDGGYNVGATFHAIIPGASIKTTQPKTPVQHKGKVLFVEDDSDINEHFSSAIKEAGYDIYTAFDGKEGLGLFRQVKPDIIISDIKMPRMDGFEFLSTVKLEDIHTPFILCTGVYPDLDNDVAKNIFKANLLIEKPYSTEKLLESIESLLANQDKRNIA